MYLNTTLTESFGVITLLPDCEHPYLHTVRP